MSGPGERRSNVYFIEKSAMFPGGRNDFLSDRGGKGEGGFRREEEKTAAMGKVHKDFDYTSIHKR